MEKYRIEMQDRDGRWFIIGGLIPEHDVTYWLARYRNLYRRDQVRAVVDGQSSIDFDGDCSAPDEA